MAEAAKGRGRVSFADEQDIDDFVAMLDRFERGEISSEEWRKFRLVRGTYGQRQDDVQMLRVKIPQGILTREQVNALADVADEHSRGFAHVTTRQNVQFHFLRLSEVERVMRRLAEHGLTTREACGNSVRNITACPFAGVAVDEVFDVTPYAEALTRYFLRHPLSACLPRKFKIAFEGCPIDHALTSINDIGWIARVRDSDGVQERGFRVTVGGGTSILATSGKTLFEFLPAAQMLAAAEAVIRVFHRFGDYEHRQRNRMKFLIKTLGWDRFNTAVRDELASIVAAGIPGLPFDPQLPPHEAAPDWQRPEPPSIDWVRATVGKTTLTGPGLRPSLVSLPADHAAYAAWARSNLKPQRQPGYVAALVRLGLGDVTGGQLRVLATLADSFGDGTLRLTPDQNVFLRWVPVAGTDDLFERLAAAGLSSAGASTIEDVTSCPGAESCKLAVTQSRGLGRVLNDAIAARPDLARVASDASIKISGCPNGCGQHHVATIGFQGSVRKIGGRAVPQYFVLVGGHPSTEGARFGRLAAKIPARRVALAVERLLELYRNEREGDERPEAFFTRIEVARVKSLLADLEGITPESAAPEDYVDLGETAAFVPEVGEGECAT
jgi:sulfite reductase beta subunit-like hemoprotein